MRELTVVGIDVDGADIICEAVSDTDGSVEKFSLRIDDRLRAAARGEHLGQGHLDIGVAHMVRPREIQSRIRAGASVEQVAAATGVDIARIERFAHPVLLERARAAELAAAAHPMLADGPAVLTLLEVVSSGLVARGLNPDRSDWDAWRNEDGHWTVQLTWKAGRSENTAHFLFTPGAHGGTVTAVDDAARELVDPDFERPLRPVAPVAQLDFEEAKPVTKSAAEPETDRLPAAKPARGRRRHKPEIPAWEDVLLGVRSGAQP